MRIVSRAADVRSVRQAMAGGVGLVPTMGALHAGHAALVRASTAECRHTAVSIFVNPTQFDDHADLDAYPRDLDRDLDLLAGLGVDLVWTPPPEEVYSRRLSDLRRGARTVATAGRRCPPRSLYRRRHRRRQAAAAVPATACLLRPQGCAAARRRAPPHGPISACRPPSSAALPCAPPTAWR